MPLAGPWLIIEKIGHSFKLQLPPGYRLHPVFHTDRLRKDPNNPLPGQYNEPEEPEEVNGELEWVVNEVLASRISNGKLQYQVR